MKNTALYWINGEIVSAEKAVVPVTDHGLLYGDGVFEGIRFYQRQAAYLAAHIDRLWDSAHAINLTVPMDKSTLSRAIIELINQYPHGEGYIRVVLTRGVGPLGINPQQCDSPNLIIIVDELQMVDLQKRAEGIRTIIASTRRLSGDGLDPRIKSLNYLNHIMAKMEANHAGVDEAILLNATGKVTEAASENLFIVKNKKLLTPPTHDGALDGITRGVILRLAASLGISAVEQSLTAYDLYTADECFLTGTGAELIPVREIDGRSIGSSRVIYQQLLAAYQTEVFAS